MVSGAPKPLAIKSRGKKSAADTAVAACKSARLVSSGVRESPGTSSLSLCGVDMVFCGPVASYIDAGLQAAETSRRIGARSAIPPRSRNSFCWDRGPSGPISVR